MIARKIPNRDNNKSKSSHGIDIYNYINNLISNKPEEKVLFSGTLNIKSKEHEEIIVEMVDLANKSRSKNPFVHIVVSFHEDEVINEETGKNLVEQILENLGYGGCQCSYAFHDNTKHKHGHICINRVDIEKLICRDDYNDVHKLHKSIAICSKKFGFKTEEHDRYVVDDEGNIHEAKYIDQYDTVKISNDAHAKEIHSGEKSMQRIAAEELPEILKTSQSWYELHERLANVGFKYIKKGGGATLIGKENGKDIAIKPSSLFREASLSYMQKRLGKYIEPSVTNSEPINRQPVAMDGVDTNLLNEHKKVIDKIDYEKDRIYKEFEQVKSEIKEDRQLMLDAALKNLPKNSIEYKAMCGAIKQHTQEQVDEITEKYKEKIENHKQIYAASTNFDTWLQINKPEEYIKYRETIERIGNKIKLPTAIDHTYDEKIKLFKEYHKAVQAERYRITCRKDGLYDENENEIQKPQVLILDKESKNSTSFGWTPESVIENIPRMSYFENRGEHIYFTPLSEHKHHLFVDDINIDSLQRLIHDGLNPSCLIQSSPDNYQAIYTLPKFGTENDKNIINDIASGMNIRYGDIGFCGAIHPHRAPGFFNTKEKYRKKYGKYPIVQLIDASGEECSLLKKYMIYMDDYYSYMNEKARKNDIITKLSNSNSNHINIQNCSNLYKIHHDDIIRINRLTAVDYSRLDFMIAVRLRATGHTMSEIERVIVEGTPERGKHSIENYAKLTTEAAFSSKGNIALDKLSRYVNIWRNMENNINDDWYFIKKEQNRIEKIEQQKNVDKNIKKQEQENKIAINNKQKDLEKTLLTNNNISHHFSR